MNGLWLYTREMLQGAEVTLALTAIAAVVSLIGGAVLAAGRMWAPAPVKAVVIGFVEVIRGTPAILQLFIIFYGLSQFGLNLSSLTAAFLWLVLYGTGYAVEIFRAGLEDVPPGQHEAAAALGLPRIIAFRRVVVPQAVSRMLPPLTSWLILELKNTTLVYFIGVHEIMYNANQGVSNSGNPLGILLIAAGIYIVINMVIVAGGSILERRRAAAA